MSVSSSFRLGGMATARLGVVMETENRSKVA